MKKFYLERSITLYDSVVFEAESLKDARRMRDNSTLKFEMLMNGKFLGRTVVNDDLLTMNDSELCELNWQHVGDTFTREEFIKRFTCLEA